MSEQVKKNKLDFVVFNDDAGKFYREQNKEKTLHETKLYVSKPTFDVQQKAHKFYGSKVREYMEASFLIRQQVDKELRKRNLWDDDKQKEFDALSKKVLDNRMKLRKGGIKLKDAFTLAKEVIKDNAKLISMRIEYNNLDNLTAEAQADNDRFNFIVAHCTFDKDDKLFFGNYDDFRKKDADGNPVPTVAGENMFKLINDSNEDFRKSWPEYQFLTKYNFVNDKLQFVKKIGDKSFLVDEEGKLIDDTGRFINENGEYIDRDGNRVDKDGQLLIESEPFYDDEDKPV